MPSDYFSLALREFMAGLFGLWFTIGGDKMDTDITPEHVQEMGKIFGEHFLSSLPPEERVKGLKPRDRVKGLEPNEVLSVYKPEDIRAFLDQLEKKNDSRKH